MRYFQIVLGLLSLAPTIQEMLKDQNITFAEIVSFIIDALKVFGVDATHGDLEISVPPNGGLRVDFSEDLCSKANIEINV